MTSVAFFEMVTATVYYALFLGTIGTILTVAQNLSHWETPRRTFVSTLVAHVASAGTAWAITHDGVTVLGILTLGLVLSAAAHFPLQNYSVSGRLLAVGMAISALVMPTWGFVFIYVMDISFLTRTLLYAIFATTAFTIALDIALYLPINAWYLRRRWVRPHEPLEPRTEGPFPKVSIHVPCYAEPPDVVIATLEALERLDYPNFEVLLIDNNTKDPALWHPVRDACARMGERFRFFHVDPISGAKAGACNFALRHTADDATLVALVDADYQAEPDFLSRLVGFYDNPKMGFVQTPHDYRYVAENAYQRACFWEYRPVYKLQIPSLNDWTASFTIGTMCLYSRRAIEEAGGWAEWCLTEDSEIALRIHALGYESVYLRPTFGRGLIPETFQGYKKQRFRWTVGPIQQLKRHWRLVIPWPFATPSKLTPMQKALELRHSLIDITRVLFIPITVVGLVGVGSMIYRAEVVPIPAVVWVGMAVSLFTGMLFQWHVYRMVGSRSMVDVVLATLAQSSLHWVRSTGVLAGFFSRKPLAWERTSKFKELPRGLGALNGSLAELGMAVAMVPIGLFVATKASYSPPDILFMIALGTFMGAFGLLSAPAMALLGEAQLRRASAEQEEKMIQVEAAK